MKFLEWAHKDVEVRIRAPARTRPQTKTVARTIHYTMEAKHS